jgi:gliding motility-associated protein GldC
MLDPETLDTLKIDLWTTKLQIQEMDRFLYQTLRSMADSYQKATGNTGLANEMQKFAQYFGEKTEIILPEK